MKDPVQTPVGSLEGRAVPGCHDRMEQALSSAELSRPLFLGHLGTDLLVLFFPEEAAMSRNREAGGTGHPGFQAGLTHPLVWPSPSLKMDDSVDPRKDTGPLKTKTLHTPCLYGFITLCILLTKETPS